MTPKTFTCPECGKAYVLQSLVDWCVASHAEAEQERRDAATERRESAERAVTRLLAFAAPEKADEAARAADEINAYIRQEAV